MISQRTVTTNNYSSGLIEAMIKYDNENHKKNIPNGKVARAIVLTMSVIDRTLRALYIFDQKPMLY